MALASLRPAFLRAEASALRTTDVDAPGRPRPAEVKTTRVESSSASPSATVLARLVRLPPAIVALASHRPAILGAWLRPKEAAVGAVLLGAAALSGCAGVPASYAPISDYGAPLVSTSVAGGHVYLPGRELPGGYGAAPSDGRLMYPAPAPADRPLPVPAAAPADALAPIAAVLDAAPEISSQTIAVAERTATSTVGGSRATEALAVLVAPRSDRLTLGAVERLQRLAGGMDGHLRRFESIVAAYTGGARLLDANFNGRIDELDKVYFEQGGSTSVAPVGELLRDRVRVNSAIVDAAQAMGANTYQFSDLEKQSFSAAFWEPTGREGVFTVRADRRPSAAVMDIFAHPADYRFECATAMVIVYQRALLDLLGPAAYDRMHDVVVGPWVTDDALGDLMERSGARVPASPEVIAARAPGAHTYFENWDVSPAGAKAGWQGENVIYLGDGQYYGHPFGITTASSIIEALDMERSPGASRSASELAFQLELDRRAADPSARPYAP